MKTPFWAPGWSPSSARDTVSHYRLQSSSKACDHLQRCRQFSAVFLLHLSIRCSPMFVKSLFISFLLGGNCYWSLACGQWRNCMVLSLIILRSTFCSGLIPPTVTQPALWEWGRREVEAGKGNRKYSLPYLRLEKESTRNPPLSRAGGRTGDRITGGGASRAGALLRSELQQEVTPGSHRNTNTYAALDLSHWYFEHSLLTLKNEDNCPSPLRPEPPRLPTPDDHICPAQHLLLPLSPDWWVSLRQIPATQLLKIVFYIN